MESQIPAACSVRRSRLGFHMTSRKALSSSASTLSLVPLNSPARAGAAAAATIRPHSHPPLSILCRKRRSFRLLVAAKSSFAVRAVDGGSTMVEKKQVAPFGSWKSPLTAELVSGASLRLGGFATDADGELLLLEGRPSESGRCVLVRKGSKDNGEDITPPGFNVRSTVHEYGGGAFSVDGETVVFSNFVDQRLYKQSLSGERSPIPLTPAYEGPLVRYADGRFDINFSRYITVREDHRQPGKEPVNEIVAVQLNGDPNTEPTVLVTGNDFYASPRISPDGMKLAWIEWCHPNMPWDATSLYVGYISEDGKVTNKVCVAGNLKDVREAPAEPKWSPQGELFFVSDRGSGFWNLYRWIEKENKVKPLHPLDAEFTRPAWSFGNSSYVFAESQQGAQIVCTYRKRGNSFLEILDASSGTTSPIDTPFNAIYNLIVAGDNLFMTAGSPKYPLSIVKVNLKELSAGSSVVWSSDALDLEEYQRFFSVPKIIEFPTKVPGETAFVNFYPPANADFGAPAGEKPPLLVRSHGGPTSESDTTLQLAIQFWTSRGWAFADVNYGGSTGYGRAYRERLYGKWGIIDVDDCCSCAAYLVASGEVDERRLCIDGRSAGGYTTLAALAFRDTFKAGASLYGVSDLAGLVEDTHKFESRYLVSLIGEDSTALHDRSPIHFPERFTCPIILFQGLEDKVVPPNQARMIYEAVKAKGIPVALVEYEGEQHGFRKAENIKYTLEQEMLFFARLVGGFKLAEDVVPVHVDNWD